MKRIITAAILLLLPFLISAQDLYRTTMVRAAPGKLLELIDAIKKKAEVEKKDLHAIRHSQGDHWDLLIMETIDDYDDTGLLLTTGSRGVLDDPMDHLISWKEELYVTGPTHREFRRTFNNSDFFHVEIFVALSGQRKQLYDERVMENKYLEELSRDPNQIFVKTQGAKWDMFTIGYYKDLKDYANSAQSSDKKEEAAAIAAGFTSAGSIGAYLRNFITEHHDTLAVKVK